MVISVNTARYILDQKGLNNIKLLPTAAVAMLHQ